MGYNRKSYIQTKDAFALRERRALDDAFERRCEVYAHIPEIEEIDRLLAATGAEIAIEIAKGKYNIEERINALKEKNLALQEKRRELLVSKGYSADYTKPRYICSKCEDTGAIGTKMCECFRQELFKNTIRNSGIGALVDSQSFESFDLKYYANDAKTLAQMKLLVTQLKEYADTFTLNSKSLLFMGKTGLGKTHLSTSIARVAIEKGYDVIYDTAQNLLSDFEFERFGKNYNSGDAEKCTDKYFDCDLLIIDDLGTELVNNFTVSTLYNLINSRINSGKPMIINTNLNPNELKAKYDERIFSRIIGHFSPKIFFGIDIRQQKLNN